MDHPWVPTRKDSPIVKIAGKSTHKLPTFFLFVAMFALEREI
jgi:hypothetical protein